MVSCYSLLASPPPYGVQSASNIKVDKPVTAVTALSLIDCLTWAIIQPYIFNDLIIRVEDHFRELARSAVLSVTIP